MKIEKMKLDKLNPAKYNPRVDLKPGDKEYEKLKRSVETFGHVLPLVWNKRTKNLVGGHQTLKVLLDLGHKEAEVSVVDLDLKKEKALNMALNRIQGEWDYHKLGDLMRELELEERELSGFDADEVAMLVKDDPMEIPDLDGKVGDFVKDGEEPNCNRSFVVYLTFKTREGADLWLTQNGFNMSIRANARTLVVQEEEIPRPAQST